MLIHAFQTAALSDIPSREPSTITEKDPLPGAASPVKHHHLVQGRRKGKNKSQLDLPLPPIHSTRERIKGGERLK